MKKITTFIFLVFAVCVYAEPPIEAQYRQIRIWERQGYVPAWWEVLGYTREEVLEKDPESLRERMTSLRTYAFSKNKKDNTKSIEIVRKQTDSGTLIQGDDEVPKVDDLDESRLFEPRARNATLIIDHAVDRLNAFRNIDPFYREALVQYENYFYLKANGKPIPKEDIPKQLPPETEMTFVRLKFDRLLHKFNEPKNPVSFYSDRYPNETDLRQLKVNARINHDQAINRWIAVRSENKVFEATDLGVKKEGNKYTVFVPQMIAGKNPDDTADQKIHSKEISPATLSLFLDLQQLVDFGELMVIPSVDSMLKLRRPIKVFYDMDRGRVGLLFSGETAEPSLYWVDGFKKNGNLFTKLSCHENGNSARVNIEPVARSKNPNHYLKIKEYGKPDRLLPIQFKGVGKDGKATFSFVGSPRLYQAPYGNILIDQDSKRYQKTKNDSNLVESAIKNGLAILSNCPDDLMETMSK